MWFPLLAHSDVIQTSREDNSPSEPAHIDLPWVRNLSPDRSDHRWGDRFWEQASILCRPDSPGSVDRSEGENVCVTLAMVWVWWAWANENCDCLCYRGIRECRSQELHGGTSNGVSPPTHTLSDCGSDSCGHCAQGFHQILGKKELGEYLSDFQEVKVA